MKTIGTWLVICLAYLIIDCSAIYAQSDPDDENWDDSYFGIINILGEVHSMILQDTNIYIGGNYIMPDSPYFANKVVKYSNGIWSSLRNGIDSGLVRTLAASDSNLYIGGYFVSVDSIIVNSIARWDGTSWNSLGSGVNGSIFSIVVKDTDVYVGGYFDTAGGIPAKNIARWDGHQWFSLSSGLDSIVLALTLFQNNIYAGGKFLFADTIPTNNIAYWDGSQWNAMGLGLDHNVYAMAVVDSTIIAGGRFEFAGGQPARHIAIWHSGSWSTIDTGLYNGTNGVVFTIAVNKQKGLCLGGSFTEAGGIAANNIVLWDSTGWHTLGSGTYGFVRTIASDSNNVYVGGSFQHAGGEDNFGAYVNKWSWPVDTTGTIMYPIPNKSFGKHSSNSTIPNSAEFVLGSRNQVRILLLDESGNVLSQYVEDEPVGARLEHQWNVSELTSGIYYCKIVSSSTVQIKKIIIK